METFAGVNVRVNGCLDGWKEGVDGMCQTCLCVKGKCQYVASGLLQLNTVVCIYCTRNLTGESLYFLCDVEAQ